MGLLPDWYIKQPPQARGDDFFLTGFVLLSTERSFPGNGVGPIPWSKAWEYGSKHGFGRRMCNFFAQVILILDGHYRDHLREEQKKEGDREARRARRAKVTEDGGGARAHQRYRAKR